MQVGELEQADSVESMAVLAGFPAACPRTGIVVQDPAGSILAVSPGAESILGMTLAQMLGRTSQDRRWASVDEDGQPVSGADHPAMRALRLGVPVRGATLGVHRPGSEAPGRHVWLTVESVPLLQPADPRPYAVVTAFRAVRGERLKDLELRDSERFYRMLGEHSSDMVAWQLLSDSTYLWASPATKSVLGLEPDEVIGMSGLDLIHPDDRGAKERWRQRIAAGDRVAPVTLRMRHTDGGYRWIETTAHVLPSAGGPPTQVITTRRDITDRVETEAARDDAIRLFEMAFEHATIGIALRDLDGTLSRVNPALCTMLGRREGDLRGCRLADFALPGEAAPANPRRGGDRREVERRFRRPDGSVVWCLETIVALPDADGSPSHLLVQLQDITQRREVAAQLERAALTDSLTGLSNRVVLEDRLARALVTARRGGHRVGVLFIDLDDFKRINDTLGHEAGDRMLREVGTRLATAVRHDDVVVRLGGDEFVVVRERVAGAADLRGLVERIRGVLARPFAIAGLQLPLTASIGVTAGADGTADELLARADRAMYRAKRRRGSGRRRFPVVVDGDAPGSFAGVRDGWRALRASRERHALR